MIGTAAGVLVAAAVGGIAAGMVMVAVAKKVITPPRRRVEDVRVIGVTGESVILSSTVDTRLPGTYGLWFSGSTGHARLGEILAETAGTVTRKLLGVDFGDLERATRARMGGWVFLTPDSLGVAYEEVAVPTALGPAPAWLIAAGPDAALTGADSGPWVIAVHGRGVRREESLRAVGVFHAAGYSTLLVSYRNDGDAPASDDGLYALGDTEWEDVDAAIGFAVARGARSVVLMGWSMGGAIVLQTVMRSQRADVVVGIVLESPVVDWVSVLTHQGRGWGLANPFRYGVLALLSRPSGGRLTGQHQPIDLARLDLVRRATELTVPILLLHSADDGFVPAAASRELALARPDIVTYEEFTVASHTRLWNFDRDRWTAAIAGWLSLLPEPSARTAHLPHPPSAG